MTNAAHQLPAPPAEIYVALNESAVITQMTKAFLGEFQKPVEIESTPIVTHYMFEGPMWDAE